MLRCDSKTDYLGRNWSQNSDGCHTLQPAALYLMDSGHIRHQITGRRSKELGGDEKRARSILESSCCVKMSISDKRLRLITNWLFTCINKLNCNLHLIKKKQKIPAKRRRKPIRETCNMMHINVAKTIYLVICKQIQTVSASF